MNVVRDIGSLMKKSNAHNGFSGRNRAAMAAALLAALQAFTARAELVYENQSAEEASSEEGAPMVQRESERDVLAVAQAARDTVRSTLQSRPIPQTTGAVYAATEADVSPVAEVEHLSKSELIRRERMRQEMRNEDILQERLEELRLRDEKRREQEILGSRAVTPADSITQSQNAPVQAPVMKEEVLAGAPIQALEPVAPAPQMQAVQMSAEGSQAPIYVSPAGATTSVSALDSATQDEKITISVAPRGGLSTMSNVSGYDVQSRFSAGVDLGVAVSDHVSFGVGYSFNEYGVTLTSSNPWVYNLQWYTGTKEALAMKQNVVDANLKLHLLGPDARLRPFIGGGAAWSKSFINYDQRIIDGLYQSGLSNLARDYEVYSILGSLSTGLDIRITKNISVGAQFEYFTVVTSRENQSLNNAAFYNYYGYSAAYADADKQVLGGSLARSAFYTVTGGLNFTF